MNTKLLAYIIQLQYTIIALLIFHVGLHGTPPLNYSNILYWFDITSIIKILDTSLCSNSKDIFNSHTYYIPNNIHHSISNISSSDLNEARLVNEARKRCYHYSTSK